MSHTSRIFRYSILLILWFPVGLVYAQGLGLGTLDDPVQRWPTAPPDSFGLDTAALAEHAQLCEDSAAVACLVAYKGYIVQEWKQLDYDYAPFVGTASATKAITALIVGMLIDDGHIASVDAPVGTYLPEWQAGVDSSVTVRHLLTMTAGLGRLRPFESVLAAKNTTSFVLGLPLDRTPGERWSYSNEGVQLLSPLMQNASGMPVATYARERLFDPLGMRVTHFYVDEYLNTVTFGAMETMLSEFARLGQLILNQGTWNGTRILSESWIEALAEPSPQNAYYGKLWWVFDDAIVAAGDGDRILAVLPQKDVVAVRLQRGGIMPGRATASYFNDRGRMHGAALDILRRVVPEKD
ncbi:MAG: hypothetical protein RhofKO_01810 [Rhodothermales bacterium]